MFLGYQGNLLAMVAQTRKELTAAPCIEFTKIVKTDEKVELIAGQYYVGASAINKARAKLEAE
ncbi:MAG: hypothetical protein K2L25_02105 [Alphaproteobacteria bacterium]|nr:hypothetical protein [Alphaproteobacteria bacterium]